MVRQVITAARVTPMRSGVSHAVKAGGMVYVTGATPFHGDRQIAQGDFAAQLHQVMRNIQAILEAAGSSLDRAVKMNVALTDMGRYADLRSSRPTSRRATTRRDRPRNRSTWRIRTSWSRSTASPSRSSAPVPSRSSAPIPG